MSNTAQLNLNVTSFVASTATDPTTLTPSQFCRADNPTIQNGPGSSGPLNASDQVGINTDGSIWVNRKNAAASAVTLKITITPGTTYTVQQIAFKQTSVGSDTAHPDPTGTNNFTNRSASAQLLSFDDVWYSKGKKKDPSGNLAPTWKYYIQIANSAGTAGWIDPGFENAEDA